MNKSLLDKIIDDKRTTLKKLKRELSEQTLVETVESCDRDFYKAMSHRSPCYILECKKASPSKGMIRKEFDLDEMIGVYGQWANVISVLTDSQYFQGKMSYLKYVRSRVTQPVLCKDFFIDAYQVYLARYHSADAILLMLSVLNDEQYKTLAQLADELQMGVLTEVSNEEELDRAISLNAKVIGINNRNLRDLSIDLDRSRKLAQKIPDDRIIISESGIRTHAQVRDLSRYVDGFLVGSSLMSQPDLYGAVVNLLFGNNKMCGITRIKDAIVAYQSGMYYGGLIFTKHSTRRVSLEFAHALVNSAPLKWVGVFQDEVIETVVEYAIRLELSVVQLHGKETPQYIEELRAKLPSSVKIWKAHGISETLPDFFQWNADIHLLDTQVDKKSGGTGKTFNWRLLDRQDMSQFVLAGGLNAVNVKDAVKTGCTGMDFNSGLEISPGIKSAPAIRATMESLRYF